MLLAVSAVSTFWLQFCALLLVSSAVVSSPSASCPLLSDRESFPTLGSAGFKVFTDPLDKPFIASANFWNGVSRDMSASSTVHRLTINDQLNQSTSNDPLLSVSTPVLSIPTKGAHGVDAFETADGTKMVVIVNYYGCGGSVEESREKKVTSCITSSRSSIIMACLLLCQHPSLTIHHHCILTIATTTTTTTTTTTIITTTVSRLSLYCYLLLDQQRKRSRSRSRGSLRDRQAPNKRPLSIRSLHLSKRDIHRRGREFCEPGVDL